MKKRLGVLAVPAGQDPKSEARICRITFRLYFLIIISYHTIAFA
jgi:hypothetical protein